jgi:choline-glycine betaine transporter
MLELIFLLIVIPKRMTRLARERNRKWALATILVWLVVETVVGVVLILMVFLSSHFLGTPEDPEPVSTLAYIPALIAALISAEVMIRRLRAKPALPTATEINTLNLS